METPVSTFRDTERNRRVEYIRSAPLSEAQFDHLTTAERYLDDMPGIPAAALVGGEFSGIRQEVAEVLNHVQCCAGAVVHLRFIEINMSPTALHLYPVQQSGEIYAIELQRLLGSLFHLHDPFWQQYYKRSRQMKTFENQMVVPTTQTPDAATRYQQPWYGLSFITLDAIDRCTDMRHSHVYQLMQQSLKWALSSYYLPGMDGPEREEAWHNAMHLVDALRMDDYKAWLLQQKAMDSLRTDTG